MLIASEKPYIILGFESKLDSTISNNEVFPGEYEIFYNDRMSDNLGGEVFITFCNTSSESRQCSRSHLG